MKYSFPPMSVYLRRFIFVMAAAAIAAAIALPPRIEIELSTFPVIGAYLPDRVLVIGSPVIDFQLFGTRWTRSFEFRQGLDIQGGMQVVLETDVSQIAEADRETALESARQVIERRVDLFGIAEPSVTSARSGDSYRILVELPGISDPAEALRLVGQTAQLDFLLLTQSPIQIETDEQGELVINSSNTDETELSEIRAPETSLGLQPTGLSGQQLSRAAVVFDPNTGEPQVSIEFDPDGTKLFGDLTREHTGEMLAIVLDGTIVTAPTIQVPILNGQAVITGAFTVPEAQQLAVQLNAGALPTPISVLEQRTIGASLGAVSVRQSIEAGLIGLLLVMLFMILKYGMFGVLSAFALTLYLVFTLALYKIIGITLTIPGIAGLLLSIGMAVDAHILIIERLREELRLGKRMQYALELGFSRAWTSIKDANTATMVAALVLINPLNVQFLNASGMVRGFGVTLFIGVLLSLWTGMVLMRVLLELFIRKEQS